jgi:hypothetical protein
MRLRPARAIVRDIAIGGTIVAAGLAPLLIPSPRPAWLPDPATCPGDVLPGVSRDDTCNPGYAKRVRDVPESVKRAVLIRDGHDPVIDKSLFEIDHRVPLAIGGANTLKNLHAEAWDGPFNAHMKDRAEFRAYKLVCRGVLTIEQAQAIFKGDWSRFYVEQFGDPAKPKFGAGPDGEMDGEYDNEGFPIDDD